MKALRGTKDILGKEIRLWEEIEAIARTLFANYAYHRIKTPIIEETGLFTKSIGVATDIVQKEMFSFKDRAGREISLRPEGTAPIVRAFIEHSIYKIESFTKLFYIGPMFRAERPQAGRQRQFHQIGAEAIGSYSPYVDAEVIAVMAHLLKSVGVKNFKIRLNSLGCRDDKKRMAKALRDSLKGQRKLFCEDCQGRYERNVFRLLDCKNENCRRLLKKVPKTLDLLCKECLSHFKTVKELLSAQSVDFEVDPYLVRGLDYYTRTAFEVTHPGLGSKDAIGAGGRYDYLIEDFGGPKVGACGFAIGFERLVMAISNEAKGIVSGESANTTVYIASLGAEAKRRGFELLGEVRNSGISAEFDYQDRSLKAQMRAADKMGAKFVAIIGEDELKKGIVTLRDMDTKSQDELKLKSFVSEIRERAKIQR
ncbi:MAG: histidine--tRNA ligase [Candidatus Omnitrophica bacterium]|nr:histidine--tRNA ligase [Candidatus Omnitrophota bacterium]